MQDVEIEEVIEVGFISFEPEWMALNQFPMEQGFDDYAFKVKQMVYMLNEVYQGTKRELKGLFNLNEAWVIVTAFNGHLYSSGISNKAVLVANVKDEIKYSLADRVFKVDGDELLRKLNQLNEFQAFTVIRMSYEFWYSPEHKVNSKNNNEDLLRNIFNIAKGESL